MAIVGKLRGVAGSCGELRGVAGTYDIPPRVCQASVSLMSTGCRRLPQIATDYRRLPQTATDHHKLSQLTAGPRNVTASPRSSPQMPNPLQMESRDTNWWKYHLRNAYCPPANIASRRSALFKARLQPLSKSLPLVCRGACSTLALQ